MRRSGKRRSVSRSSVWGVLVGKHGSQGKFHALRWSSRTILIPRGRIVQEFQTLTQHESLLTSMQRNLNSICGANFEMTQAKLVFLTVSMAALLSTAACSRQDGVRKISGQGFSLDVHDHSGSLTRLLAINSENHVLGLLERPGEKTEEVFDHIYFYHDGRKKSELPKLDGFTNIEAVHLSDNGLVVGFASRRLGHPDGSLAAILWEPAKEKLTKLNPVEGDNASHAQSISADGQKITGYSTGANPARLRPCVWTQKNGKWVAEALPVAFEFNPFLMSGGAVISPNGKIIAASITEEQTGNGIYDSSVFIWQEKNGAWEGEFVCSDPMRIHSVNNQGECVGEFTVRAGRMPFKIAKDGMVTALPLLEGDTTGEAWAINDQGVVVGISDNFSAPDGGPRPVRWVGDKVEPLKLPEGSEFGGSYAINKHGRIAGMSDFPIEAANEQPETKAMGFIWAAAVSK